METTEKKKRETLDEYIGVKGSNATWVLVVAIISSVISGGILSVVSPVCGLYGGYYIFKQRKDPGISTNTKRLRIVLFVVWLIMFGIFK